jgi:cytochrome c biogenesis protein CcmG, thiol:disulfide interchange protein DsbE
MLAVVAAALVLSALASAAAAPPLTSVAGPDVRTGRQISLGDYRGKPVVINFWGSWCGGCLIEAHDLVAFAKAHPAVPLIGVDTEDSKSSAREFYRRYGFTHPSIFDPQGAIGKRLRLKGLPSTLFLDRRHRIVATVAGTGTRAKFEAGLRLALAR